MSCLKKASICVLFVCLFFIQNLFVKLQVIVYFFIESLKDILEHAFKNGAYYFMCMCVGLSVYGFRCPQNSEEVV